MHRTIPLAADLPESALRKLVEKWSPSTLLLFSALKTLETLAKLGMVPKEDAWRRWTRAFHRGEDAKILIPVFRLRALPHGESGGDAPAAASPAPRRACIVEGLTGFLRSHRDLLRRRLHWHRISVRIVPNQHVDVVEAEFDESGNLLAIAPHFDHPLPAPPDRQVLDAQFINVYNATRQLADKRRPYVLAKTLRAAVAQSPHRAEALAYFERLTAAVFVHFEGATPQGRFAIPDFSRRKHPGHGVFNILSRLYPGEDELDLWFQASHVLIDGNPLAELLGKLRGAWPAAGPLTVPAPSRSTWTRVVSPPNGGRPAVCTWRFLSFEELFRVRKELNQEYSHLVGEITLASLIVWGLAQHPAIPDVKVATAADLLPRPGRQEDRTLSFINSRPARFLDPNDRERSFLRFQADFNQQIEAARRRESAAFRALYGCALLRRPLYHSLTHAVLPRALDDICGKVCLTILKDAEFCVSPLDDTKEAVISIGKATLSAEGGATAGVVSLKTIAGKEDAYREAVCGAICNWRL
jgi:hypothetical protein